MWLILVTVAEIPSVVCILSYYLMQTCNVFTRTRQVFVILNLNGSAPIFFASRTVLIYLFPCKQTTLTWYVLLFYIGIGVVTLVVCLDVPNT